MSRVVLWLKHHENRMFFWINQKHHHNWLRVFFSNITHLGGATLTIIVTLSLYFFTKGPWSAVGLQSFVALAASHLPVALIKKWYPRLRPYMVLPDAITCNKPLKDHSFPSGHTTAIFSVVIPFIAAMPVLAILLLPLAVTVAVSRIYLGLHYPSDCVAGSLIGTVSAVITVSVLG